MPVSLQDQKRHYCRDICHAWCCRHLDFFYTGDDKDIEKFFSLRGITYDPLTKQVICDIKCKWITTHNKCKLYSWRPDICRAYECDKLKNIEPLHYL